MSSFMTPLVVTALPGGRKWKLKESFQYHVGSRYSHDVIRVPRGFETDFASTDALQWVAGVLLVLLAGFAWVMPVWAVDLCLLVVFLAIIITPYGRQKKAAVVHDYLYQNRIGSRKYADDVFYEAMLVERTWAPKARLMWAGVRLFGWLSWKDDDARETSI